MGLVYAEITLKNAVDVGYAQNGSIMETEIRQTTVQALVDTEAGTLVINETIRQVLGLKITGTRQVELADGARQEYAVTQPVNVQWKNRETTCLALVLPDSSDVLLGAIPLEDMDLIVNPVKQELVGAHGDEILCMIK